jgi:hypothetical protein
MLTASFACSARVGCGGGGAHPSASASGTTSQAAAPATSQAAATSQGAASSASHEYASACSMTLASRQRPQHGKQCPELSDESGGEGYALLARSGSTKPEEFMAMRREGGAWKTVVFALFPLVPKVAMACYEAALHE